MRRFAKKYLEKVSWKEDAYKLGVEDEHTITLSDESLEIIKQKESQKYIQQKQKKIDELQSAIENHPKSSAIERENNKKAKEMGFPSYLEMAKNLSEASIMEATAKVRGVPAVTDEIKEKRYNICWDCEFHAINKTDIIELGNIVNWELSKEEVMSIWKINENDYNIAKLNKTENYSPEENQLHASEVWRRNAWNKLRCYKCGCVLKNKTTWRSQQCPLKKWGPNDLKNK